MLKKKKKKEKYSKEKKNTFKRIANNHLPSQKFIRAAILTRERHLAVSKHVSASCLPID